jgi:hypothetical protein
VTTKNRGQASKNKGKSWERDIADYLTTLYGEKFIRVPHSGAYIGGKNSERKTQLNEGQIRSFKGDINPPQDWIRFNCEAKNYADFPFHQLFTGSNRQLETWLEQLLAVADNNDLNILIIKISRKGKFVAVESKYHWNFSISHFKYSSQKYGEWTLYDFDQFWSVNHDLVRSICTQIG